MSTDTGLRQATLRGALWTFGMRWGLKIIGLANTMILARLLPPSDFGIIAMAMLAIGFLEIWTSFNTGIALIQKKDAVREHYDTAWTLRLIEVLVLATVISIGAPYAADYFQEPRLTPVLWLMAGSLMISGFANIGVIDFRKKLQFHKEFQLNISARLISFVATILLALWLGDYWALALGIATGYVAGLALSYGMHPYRPRLSLSRFRELFAFSQWLMVRNIALFFEGKADQLFLGKVASTHTLGLYNTAGGLAELPSNELAHPLARVLFPVMSTIQDQPERLRKGYLLAINGVNSITLPAGVGLALLAHLAIPVLLGDQWLDAIPFLQALAIFGVLRVSYSATGALLMATGKPRYESLLMWLHVTIFVGLGFALYPDHGINGIIAAKIVTAGIMAVIYFAVVVRQTTITPLDIVKALVRPVLATGLMAFVLTRLPATLTGNVLVDLVAFSLAGATVYGLALLALWWIGGRPDGTEAMVLSRLLRRATHHT